MPSHAMAKSCLVKRGNGEVMQRLVMVMHCYAEFSEGGVKQGTVACCLGDAKRGLVQVKQS